MDFDFPTDDDPRRSELRAWLAEHPSPTSAELHEAGLLVPHWPRPWGVEADPIHQLIIDEELKAAGVRETSVSTNPMVLDGPLQRFCLRETAGKKNAFFRKFSAEKSNGANSSANPTRGQTLHRWQPGRFEMATSTSSTVQKSGRAVPIIRNTEYSSREPTLMCRNIKGSPTSSFRWIFLGSHCHQSST